MTAAPSSPPTPDEALAARAVGLTKRFGDLVAVDAIDLVVPEGSIVGVIGPSGSGKTTTVRMLLGVVTPTDGLVEVFGTPPAQFTPQQRSRLGYMPQHSALYPNLSIEENLHFAASIYGLPFKRRERFEQLLTFVELDEHRDRLLRDASGGMQRRVALAAALLHDPSLLFLDEPTTGLDPVLRRKLWDHFAQLRAEGRTVVVTTQYVGEAAHCDRVALIVDGALLVDATPDLLRRRAFGGDYLDVTISGRADDDVVASLLSIDRILGIERMDPDGRHLRLLVSDAQDDAALVRSCLASSPVEVVTMSRHEPSFDDAFVQLVAQKRGTA
ncbi:MAG TPA: ABC transporter ATP-binding protein [Egibacteraceae bacterium]|nr:ABC transporter ATP-binding protein [Egibacteraceae bacterium]